MSDDIVTRLRLWASVTKGDYVIEELHKAADEIERLRAYVLSFPCSCWIDKPKCVRCEVAEAGNES